MDSIYWFAWTIVSRLEVNFMVFRKKNTDCKKVDNFRTRVARSEIRSIIFTIPCTFRQIDTYILFSNELLQRVTGTTSTTGLRQKVFVPIQHVGTKESQLLCARQTGHEIQ